MFKAESCSNALIEIDRLKRSHAFLQAILDTTVDGIVTIDTRGHIQSFNPAAEKIFRYKASEVLGRNVSMLMPEPYRNRHDGYLKAYLETGRKNIIGSGREVVGLRSDGTTFPLYLAVSETRAGNEVFFSGILRDISVQKAYEARLVEANAELEAFAHTLSHDLRSLLTPIIGYADLMLRGMEASMDDIVRDSLQVIETQGERMVSLIDDLLALARAGHLEAPETPTDLDEQACECAQEVRHLHQLPESAIDIRASGIKVAIHPALIRQIYLNLLVNAAHHGGPQGLPIIVRAEKKHDRVLIRVADHGPGVPEDERERIFETFFRGRHGKTRQGTGIGLATVRKIAMKSGGTAWVEQTPGGGATFVVEMREPPEKAS